MAIESRASGLRKVVDEAVSGWMTSLRSVMRWGFVLLVLAPWVFAAAALALEADVVLQGGTVYDGTGADGLVGDVAISGDKIVAVGQFSVEKADRVIDCRRLVVAPGFIDLHTHSDQPITQAKTRNNLNYLTQGCTTVVTGNCGGGRTEVDKYFNEIDREGAGTNVIHLMPHGSVRRSVMGSANRAPTPEELERLKSLIDRGMREGAWGMSTGLIYVPSAYAETDEIVALAKVVASHGGIYVSHIRNEGDHLLEALGEAIEIGRRAKVPVEISHFKVTGAGNWGRVREAARLIEQARREGVTVTADQYPYIATSTSLDATLFPATKIPGGRSKLSERMAADPSLNRLVRELVASRLHKDERIVIASSKKYPQWVGKSLSEIASSEEKVIVDVALEIQANGGASVVKFCLSEEDVRYVMGLPWVATGSDGRARLPDPALRPHPRNFGTFARKIGCYALDQKVISLAQAIRSSSGLPADILGLPDRGYLRPGAYADVVVFDPERFIDRATFDSPQEYSTGVRYLLVAGHVALADGKPSATLHGRAIRHRWKPQRRDVGR